jgi:hypothetical protein
MKTIKRNNQKLKILLMFIIMGMMSFIPEKNPKLFGDYVCKGAVLKQTADFYYVDGCKMTMGNSHSPTKHWGFRHWVWFAAGLTFAVWTIVEVINNKE